jgi:hypothetical protein
MFACDRFPADYKLTCWTTRALEAQSLGRRSASWELRRLRLLLLLLAACGVVTGCSQGAKGPTKSAPLAAHFVCSVRLKCGDAGAADCNGKSCRLFFGWGGPFVDEAGQALRIMGEEEMHEGFKYIGVAFGKNDGVPMFSIVQREERSDGADQFALRVDSRLPFRMRSDTPGIVIEDMNGVDCAERSFPAGKSSFRCRRKAVVHGPESLKTGFLAQPASCTKMKSRENPSATKPRGG